MIVPLVIAVPCKWLFVIEVWHECIVAEVRLEEDAREAKLIDFVADLSVFILRQPAIEKILFCAGGNGGELAHDGNRQLGAEIVVKPFQYLKGILHEAGQDEMADHHTARGGDFARFVKRAQKTYSVNKITDGVPRDGRIIGRTDAALRQVWIGEFEVGQENVDDFTLFAEHFDAGVARTVPDERNVWMVFSNGFAKFLDMRPPMFRRHEIEIMDVFRDQFLRFSD